MAEQKNVQEQDINQLIKVRRDKLKELQENGKDPFQITKYDVTNHSTDIKDDFDAFEGKEVSIAGRMMFKRVMGTMKSRPAKKLRISLIIWERLMKVCLDS